MDQRGQKDLQEYTDGGTTELAVTKIDYTVANREGDGDPEPVVHVFGRTPSGELRHVRVHGFRPYFYAPTEEVNGAEDERVTGIEEGYRSIEGRSLTRIYTRIPADVGEVREGYTHYEADILFPNRFRIDVGVRSGIRVPDDGAVIDVGVEDVEPCDVDAPTRVMVLDIEVDDRRGFPEDGEEPIIAVTAWDSFTEKYTTFVLDSEVDADHDVHSSEDEEEMLDKFLDYVGDRDPDVLTGWNFDDFDAPYIIDRLDALDMDSSRLSRVGEVWHSGWGGPTIKGRTTFDLLYGYQRMRFTELESYRLDAIAEEELGSAKVHYTGSIGDLWENDPGKLVEYNRVDVELCVEIDEKAGIVDFFRELARFVGCSLEDSTTPSDVVDIYVLRKAHGRFVLPSKRSQSGEEYEGGEVFEPITGIRENVAVLDLACFSEDTELLTPDGIKNIKEVGVGDEVYTLDPDTFECEIQKVTDTHEYQNAYGELHHVSGNTHDFKVTENHNFLVSSKRGWGSQEPEDFDLFEYRGVPDYERYAFPTHAPVEGEKPEKFSMVEEVEEDTCVVIYGSGSDMKEFRREMPAEVRGELDWAQGSSGALGLKQKVSKYFLPIEVYRRHREVIDRHAESVFLKQDRQHRETPLRFEMENWLRFLGWYVTEGSTYHNEEKRLRRVTIHQSEGELKNEIRELLDGMGLNYSIDEGGVNVSNEIVRRWLVENCGDGSAYKKLPEWVFDLDSELLVPLLETMIKGDGTPSSEGVQKFWTKSDPLKRDFVRLAVHCGDKPTVKKESDGCWYVSVGKRGSFLKQENAVVEDHDGKVYCVTAEKNHVVLAGRNGKFQWVGQSLYPMSMVTINASPETKVGEDYDGEVYGVDVPGEGVVRFRKDREGLTKNIVTELLEERDKKKRQRDQYEMGSEEYEKYDNQQNAIKVVMNCFSEDTEVVAEDGLKNIKDIEVGERVYSIDPETNEVELKEVVGTQEYDYDGRMVDVRTRFTDFRVTPNHRMLVERDGDNEFVEAGDLNDYTNYQIPNGKRIEGKAPETFSLLEETDPEYAYVHTEQHGRSLRASVGEAGGALTYESNRKAYKCNPELLRENPGVVAGADRVFLQHAAKHSSVPHEFGMKDWLRFIGWYVTEGSVYEIQPKEYDSASRGRSKKIQLGQLDTDGRDELVSLLESMGLNPSREERQISVSNTLIADWLTENCGKGSENKRLPDFVFDLDWRLLNVLFETLIKGDGDTHSGVRYSTKSERLKDDVVRLAVHLGYKPLVNRDSGVWRIRFSRNKGTFRMHGNGGTSSNDDGKVYCVTVRGNHTVLAGRNGRYQWVGQSYYGVAGYSRFRLYDREMGSAVTATGRKVIEHTRDAVEDLGYEVIYGDTDSTLVELGRDRGLDEVIEAGEELEREVNASYDEFAREEFNAEDHRWMIEFEKVYRRFFQAGKKKRYAGHLVWKEGREVDEIDITGFEYKRSDVARITKDVQEEVITRIVRGEDFESVASYLKEVIEEFKAGGYSYDYVAIPGGIGQKLDNYDTDTAHVKGAKYANEYLGTNFRSGSKPKRLYIKRVKANDEGLPPTEVVCFEYPEQVPDCFVVDWDKMLDKTLKKPISRILEPLGWSWSEVESGQRQQGLGSYT